MTAVAEPDQFIAHCPGGHVIRGTAAQFNEGRGWLTCGCGLHAPARRMDVQYVGKIPCGRRCHRAKGVQCHCACAGRNHGSAFTYRESRTRA